MGRNPCRSQPEAASVPARGPDCCRPVRASNESDGAWDAIRHIRPTYLKTLRNAKAHNRPVIGFTCPMTPVELILAAGGLAVDVSGDSAQAARAARNCLPASACALACSTCGTHIQESNPLLELAELVVGEATCESRQALYRLMDTSRPVYTLRPPGPPGEKDLRERWACEVRKFCVMLEKRFERPITDDHLLDAIRLMNRQRILHRELAGFFREPAPPLTGLQLMQISSRVPAMPPYLEALQALIEQLRTKPREPSLASRVRVLVTGSPLNQQAARVIRAIEENGGLVVAFENCTGHWRDESDIPTDTGDPLQAIADRYFHWPCIRRVDSVRRKRAMADLIASRHVDAVIEIAWESCPSFEKRIERDAAWIPATFRLPYHCVRPHFAPREKAAMRSDIAGLLRQTTPSLAHVR